ncbi:MAG TPA: amidohydrolase family protein [Dongiaceae bacterium]
MPNADAHLHLFRHGFPGRYGKRSPETGSELETYERFRKEHDIGAGLIVGYEGDGIEPDNNRYIRALAETRRWMSTLAYVAHNATPDGDAIDRLMQDGHRGIAVYTLNAEAARSLLGWNDAWARLDTHRAIVSFNAPPEATAELAPVITKNSRCTFLFSHLGLPGRHAAIPSRDTAAARLAPLLHLAELPNAMVKISGLYAVSDPPHAYPHDSATPFIETLLDRFGTGRCCWGSDFSPSLDFVSFAQTLAIPVLEKLRASDRDRVMGGNLLKVLGR